jgi:hypothetical protein
MALRRLPNEVAQVKLSLEMAKRSPKTAEYHVISTIFVILSVYWNVLCLFKVWQCAEASSSESVATMEHFNRSIKTIYSRSR